MWYVMSLISLGHIKAATALHLYTSPYIDWGLRYSYFLWDAILLGIYIKYILSCSRIKAFTEKKVLTP